MEKEYKYIYNPHLLNLLYLKVVNKKRLERIIAIFIYHRGDLEGGGGSEEMCQTEREHLIRENLYDAQIISDIHHLTERMKNEKYQFDIYHCNYEFVLFRMFLLFLPEKDLVQRLPEDFREYRDSLLESKFICEEKILSIMNESDLSGVILRYLYKFYSSDLVNYEAATVKRASLLFNIKRSAEEQVLQEQISLDEDCCLIYNAEVVMTMMYLFFVNEFLAIMSDEKSFLSHSHYTSVFEEEPDDRKKSEREMKEKSRVIDEKIQRIDRVYKLLSHYLYSQFSGPLLCSHPPPPSKSPLKEDNDIYRSTPNKLYLNPLFNPEREYTKMVNQRNTSTGSGFLLKPKSIGHLKYMRLSRNKHIYQYIVRRFIFDHELRLSHQRKCNASPPLSPLISPSLYTSTCQICRYLKSITTLNEFYETVENCFYTLTQEREEDENRRKVQWYLGGFILDSVDAMDSLIYKNAWQMMRLFRTYSLVMELSPDSMPVVDGDMTLEGEKLDLFYIVNIQEMIRYAREHYEEEDGQGEFRMETILRVAKKKSKTIYRIEEWQKALALDQDIYQLIFRAVGSQVNEIEKFERSILPISRIAKEPGKISRMINSILSDIFLLYDSILLSTMTK